MFELIYINAMLSDASYVPLKETYVNASTGELKESARDAFKQRRGWTDGQFSWFKDNFKVYLNSNGDLAHQQNTDTGFAATMFGAENYSCISSTPYV